MARRDGSLGQELERQKSKRDHGGLSRELARPWKKTEPKGARRDKYERSTRNHMNRTCKNLPFENKSRTKTNSGLQAKTRSGFTIVELLIVIAIIVVLVVIAIPVMSAQLEKARKTVDLHTARTIESVLATAMNDGTIDPVETEDAVGAWVVICRDKDSWPAGYGEVAHDTVFFGADNGLIINGKQNTTYWNVNNEEIEKIFKQSGLNVDSLKVTSHGGEDGWDWIVIEIGYMNNEVFTRIYSGMAGEDSGADELAGEETNIEKMIG